MDAMVTFLGIIFITKDTGIYLLLQLAQLVFLLEEGQGKGEPLLDVGLGQDGLQLLGVSAGEGGTQVGEVHGVIHNTLSEVEHLLQGLAVQRVQSLQR